MKTKSKISKLTSSLSYFPNHEKAYVTLMKPENESFHDIGHTHVSSEANVNVHGFASELFV